MKFSQIPSFPFEFLSHPLLAATATHHYQENIFGRRASKNMIDWWIEIFFSSCEMQLDQDFHMQPDKPPWSVLCELCCCSHVKYEWYVGSSWDGSSAQERNGWKRARKPSKKKTAFIEFSSYRRRGECRSETHSRTVQQRGKEEKRQDLRYRPSVWKYLLLSFAVEDKWNYHGWLLFSRLVEGCKQKEIVHIFFLLDIAQNWSSSRLRFSIKLPPSLARSCSHFPESLDDRRSDELALHLCTTLGIASDTVFRASNHSHPDCNIFSFMFYDSRYRVGLIGDPLTLQQQKQQRFFFALFQSYTRTS